MSVVAIHGVPAYWKLDRLVGTVSKVVKGHFEALNFQHGKGGVKTAFIRVSEKLDPLRVVESINRLNLHKCKLVAVIPNSVPDLPLCAMTKRKDKKKKARVPLKDFSPEQILATVHSEILTELVTKYTGLNELSQKTSHRLLDDLAETIFNRLKHIIDTNPSSYENCFKLSSLYRKAHPHFGDFQMILMALHRLEDAAGSARTQVSEQELSAYNNKAHALDTIPYSQLQNWSVKYADRISKKILEHIDGLDVNVGSSDRPEDVARRRVRAELKKLVPYLPTIVRDVATEQMTPDHNNSVFRMRIYGEPFLPNHHSVDPILRKLRATHISRSSFTFNMVRFNVPSATYHQTIALNGKEVDGAKLIVRFSMGMNYKVKPELKLSMATAFDPASNLDPMALADMEEEIGFENGGSWDE